MIASSHARIAFISPGAELSQNRALSLTKAALPLDEAVSHFGASLKAKLSGKGAIGAPEDQLRAPLEALLADVATILLFKKGDVVAVGEGSCPSTWWNLRCS